MIEVRSATMLREPGVPSDVDRELFTAALAEYDLRQGPLEVDVLVTDQWGGVVMETGVSRARIRVVCHPLRQG